jgi:hypothetical protein
MAKNIAPLAEASLSITVGPHDLASLVDPGRPGTFPAVLATSRMVARS